ncbi:hypothetical protein TELCIR_01737 [Teladorsagia circumcincta]|uniref:Histone-lysine N-methyltransferase SETMAR n=1 Tax=Teladorsagia circumcincta TaxID=45464 RepID=A0A2G9V138_TELCI|nr:hypothetical protein TELCIR_01737 [Teladorsagia circumcincta]
MTARAGSLSSSSVGLPEIAGLVEAHTEHQSQWRRDVCNCNHPHKQGEFTVEDRQRSGRLSSVENDQIKMLIETNRHITTREIGEKLDVLKPTIHEHLMELGFVKRLDVWVPHKLSERNLMDRVSVCGSLLKQNENEPFLKRMVTGTRSGSCTTTWSGYDRGAILVDGHRKWSRRANGQEDKEGEDRITWV